jgi:hypothetical protein
MDPACKEDVDVTTLVLPPCSPDPRRESTQWWIDSQPPAGDLHPLLTGSGPVTFRGLACLKNGALAPSPADEKPQSHDDPNHNENLDYHPEVPPKKSTEFHVDHPSIRGHLSALLSASLRPRGPSGKSAVDCLARRGHPEQLVRRALCGTMTPIRRTPARVFRSSAGL